MKHAFILTAGLVALGGATAAQAVEFRGGDVSFTSMPSYYGGAYDYTSNRLAGSVELGFGSAFGLQFDGAAWVYSGSANVQTNFGVHAFYAVSDSVTAGAYYTYDNWTGSKYDSYGVEAMIDPGWDSLAARFEVYAGAYRNIGFNANPLIGVTGYFDVSPNITLSAGYLVSGWPDFSAANRFDVASVAATYKMDNGFYTRASLDNFIYLGADRDITVGFQIGYEFGGGVTFGRRGYTDLFPGD